MIRPNQFYRQTGKRILDIVLAIVALVSLFPLIVGVAVLVRLRLGQPIFFRQMRPGLYGKPFQMIKFRSMTDAYDTNGNLLPDDERLTRFGGWLRSTSLDELPELWNVLRGEMSLVGPRPLLMSYLERYTPRQAQRHDVKPGLTGWAQVNGRNTLAWEDRFEMDVWYVEHMTLRLDMKIILWTFDTVLGRSGISEQDKTTMSEFMGSHE